MRHLATWLVVVTLLAWVFVVEYHDWSPWLTWPAFLVALILALRVTDEISSRDEKDE